ncbi:MAG: ATP-grasp domain-containing protein, partial [Planctomycetaceae bacterium]
PETGGLLAERIRIAEEAGADCCNCSPAATELCGDKLRLCEFLRQRSIPAIETVSLAYGESPHDIGFPCVVKPRDGAGSEGCRRFDSPAGRAESVTAGSAFESARECVVQPFLAGVPVSTVALVQDGRRIVFPVGRQVVDGASLRYRGGIVPETVAPGTNEAVAEIVQSCLATLEGLHGLVGFDLICPDDCPREPVLLEINPRLTTAYVGYRNLTQRNLAECVLFPERLRGEIAWDNSSVRFSPDGRCVCNGPGP